MKKWFMAISVLLLIALLTSCARGDFELKVNKDGSGKYTATIGIEEEAYDRVGGRVEGVIDSAHNDLESQGFEVESYTEDGFTGFRASKSFDDLQEMDTLPTSGGLAEAGAGAAIGDVPVDITTEQGLFTNTYRVEGEVDLERSGVLGGMQQLVSDQLELTFTLDLPISPKSHNADRVEGNVLQWGIATAGTTHVMVEMAVPNVRNIIIGSVILLAALAVTGFVIYRKRKTK